MRTIIELAYDLKKSLGKWYTVFFRIILPFLIYLIPINIIIARTSDWLVENYLKGIQDLLSGMRSPYFHVMWAVVALVFLALLIFAPKAATVMEFVFGIYFIILAFKYNYVNPLGIALIISVSVFLFFKLLLLIVNIMYKVEYGYDDVERGESGRRVRKSDSDFFFG
ncbi:MAG: hypothetical protein II190_00420 [Ruminococcus sp.]|nr:hypothetical protein [Ruminococcus sp.]